MSAAWHIVHEDGNKEIVHDLAEAIIALVEISRNEEAGEVRWSS